MPRNDFYPYQKPYSQDESYLYNEYDNYDYGQKLAPKPHHCCPPCPCPKPEPKPPHHCCPPCPCPKPEPKPEPKHECKLISAQLSRCSDQSVTPGSPFNFTDFDGVSDTNQHAPLYYDTLNNTIIFKKAGRFIVTYGADVHIQNEGRDVILALKLDGDTKCASISHVESAAAENEVSLSKTALINVHCGSTLSLVALQNEDPNNIIFKWTNLVIDEKCKLDDKCD